MKTYSVQLEVFASMSVTVEAEDEESARAKAEEIAGEPSLCHCCARKLSVDGLGEITEVLEIAA